MSSTVQTYSNFVGLYSSLLSNFAVKVGEPLLKENSVPSSDSISKEKSVLYNEYITETQYENADVSDYTVNMKTSLIKK